MKLNKINKDIEHNRTKRMKSFATGACLITSILLIITSFGSSTQNAKKRNSYTYSIDKDVIYKVNLKDNDFFDNDYLGMDKIYTAAFVDSINFDFLYDFKISKKENMNYKYNVTATIYVDSTNNNKNIWEKEYVLVEDKEVKVTDKDVVNIRENVVIDYKKYNEIAKEFRANIVSNNNAYMKVKMNVIHNIEENKSDKEVNENSNIEVTFNLNQDIFQITKKTSSGTENLLNPEIIDRIDRVHYIQLVIGVVGLLGSLAVALNIGKKYYKFDTRSEYSIVVNKILKNYGDIVAEIVHPVNLENLEIIDVRNFDQMLDVEEELRMPILFYEITRGEEGCFVIIHNNIAYRYILRNKKRRRGIF